MAGKVDERFKNAISTVDNSTENNLTLLVILMHRHMEAFKIAIQKMNKNYRQQTPESKPPQQNRAPGAKDSEMQCGPSFDLLKQNRFNFILLLRCSIMYVG